MRQFFPASGWRFFIVIGCLFTSSCAVPHRQNRKEFDDAIPPLGKFSPDSGDAAENLVFEDYDEFLLSHIEFDDQGKMWEAELDDDMNQLEALEHRIENEMKMNRTAYKNGILLVTFAHGWRHDSREGDKNLADFRIVMQEMARAEKAGRDRRVVGVYLGWRGGRLRERTPLATVPVAFTYWDRKATAQYIGYNAMGETLTRLGRLKAKAVKDGEGKRPGKGKSRAIVIGHSFGAAAIFSGVQRYFEDELIRVKQKNYQAFVRRRWDLVVLINPAFEALRYETIHRYNSELPPSGTDKLAQIPRMMVVSAVNDSANKMLLPVGQTLGDLFRPKQRDNVRFREKHQHTTALGFYDDFLTHKLVKEHGKLELQLSDQFKQRANEQFPNGMQAYSLVGQSYLKPFAQVFHPNVKYPRVLPFMVVRADEAIVDNHNDIWKPEFHKFILDFIEAKEQAVDRIKP